MENKKVILIGCVGVGNPHYDPRTEIALAALEEKHNCKVEVVNLADPEKQELKVFASELVLMRCKEANERIEMISRPIIALSDCSKELRNYEKQNSQQGWKNRPKHKR